jgi:hypothetical protein
MIHWFSFVVSLVRVHNARLTFNVFHIVLILILWKRRILKEVVREETTAQLRRSYKLFTTYLAETTNMTLLRIAILDFISFWTIFTTCVVNTSIVR